MKSNYENKSLIDLRLFCELISFISLKRKIQLLLAIALMVLSGLSELLTLGLALPFLTIITNSADASENATKNFAINFLPLANSSNYSILISIGFALSVLASSLIKITNIKISFHAAALIGNDLACISYKKVLSQSYLYHVKKHSSSLISIIITQVSRTVNGINALLQLISASVISLFLLIGLLLISYKVALVATLIVGTLYSLIAYFSRLRILKNSKIIAESSQNLIKILQESLGSIKDVILQNSQTYYDKEFASEDSRQRIVQSDNQFTSVYPRYLLEGIILFLIAIACTIYTIRGGSNIYFLPVLGSLALGAQRLLPATQQIYSNWVSIKGYTSDMYNVLSLLRLVDNEAKGSNADFAQINFKNQIILKNVRFTYDNNNYVLQNINIIINKGERIGIIGTTGSGKTTVTDILMSLLHPSSGEILIDGINISKREYLNKIRAWRELIAHVPQDFNLFNMSVMENVAFGIERSKIIKENVVRACKAACIHEFILSLPGQYDFVIDENGINLSGGQKQRIAIARALYRNSQLLVFDEATSALDNETELTLMQSIESLSKDITIVIIAHRLSTIANCDKVYRIEKGFSTIIKDNSRS